MLIISEIAKPQLPFPSGNIQRFPIESKVSSEPPSEAQRRWWVD